MKTCPECPATHNRRSAYCSDACQRRAYTRAHPRKKANEGMCVICSKPVPSPLHEVCSKPCADERNRQRDARLLHPHTVADKYTRALKALKTAQENHYEKKARNDAQDA